MMLGLSLPSDTVIHDIKLKADIIGQTEQLARATAVFYAVEGYLLPVLDPDTPVAFNTMWDQLVPKDTTPAVSSLDLDTSAADTSPFFEPGIPDMTGVYDVGLRPERVYHRHKTLTINDGALHIFQDTEAPFAVVWMAGDTLNIRLKKRLRIRQPMVLMFAIACPDTTQTTTVVESSYGEKDWAQVKFIKHVLERAILHEMGLVEAGAETPWTEATDIMRAHLEPNILEVTAGFYKTETFEVQAEMLVDHSVVGELGRITISGGR